MREKYKKPIVMLQLIAMEDTITAASVHVTPGGDNNGTPFINEEIIQESNENEWTFFD